MIVRIDEGGSLDRTVECMASKPHTKLELKY